MQAVLLKTLQSNQAKGQVTHLLDVACGGARHDLEVLKRCPPESYRAVLRDYRRENVEKATQLAHQFGLTVEITPGFGDFEVWQDSVGIFGVVRAKRENIFSC